MYNGTTGTTRLQKEYREIKQQGGLNQIGGSAGIINKDYKDYPSSRPLARFKTKIWHPNVDRDNGNICLDYIKGNWTSNNTMREAILSIFYLLTAPNFESPLNSKAKGPDYEKTAREYNGKYAFQSQEYNWMENYDNWS